VKKGEHRKMSTGWVIAISGWSLAIILFTVDHLIPYFAAKRNLPQTKIRVTQQTQAGRDSAFYGIEVINFGNSRDEKIKITFVMKSPSKITSIRILNPDRVKLAGKQEYGAVFILEELYPKEWQLINIQTTRKGDYSIAAWSEKLKEIKKISKISIEVGPEEIAPGRQDKNK
jgi:hypothetical protein